MSRIRISHDDRRGARIAIKLGGVEHVMTPRQAADLAAEIQHGVVECVNGTIQLALDRKDGKTWRIRAIEALRAHGISGPDSAQDFLQMVIKTPTHMRGSHLQDVKQGDDALDFSSDHELERLVKEHGIEVEGSSS